MFEPVSVIEGVAAPLPLANVDTDVIIRIERLTTGDPARIGDYAFEALRYLFDGTGNPEFILNRPGYRDAPILMAGPNFGCGSSREPAVTALLKAGIRTVIASSFGDIFYANCFQNGLLPVRLPERNVLDLIALAERGPSRFSVDLTSCAVRTGAGTVYPFTIDAQRREALLAGLDDIGLTLREVDTVAEWQTRDRAARPWIWEIAA